MLVLPAPAACSHAYVGPLNADHLHCGQEPCSLVRKNPTALNRFVRRQNDTPRKREVFILAAERGETGCMGVPERGARQRPSEWVAVRRVGYNF
jgi:hypothetical protein